MVDLMGVRTWIEGWPVYRQLTGTDPLGRGAAAKSDRSRRAHRPHRDRRLGGPLGLPVLRGRLRAAGLRQGRPGHPDRGRPGQPDLPGPALPEGLGQQEPGHQRRRGSSKVLLPPAVRRRDWEELDLDTAMDMIADRVLAARDADLGGRRRRGPAAQPHAGHLQPRRRDAGQRRELPDQEAVHRDGRASRSRTRPVFDTPPPSPVWGPASVVAGPPDSSRIWPTPTASSSRARTWPRPTRWASSG